MKIGDKVRFLNEVGGGIIKGFQGKDIVLVEDADGFDIPMNKKEVVIIDTDKYNLERIQPEEDKEPARKNKIDTHKFGKRRARGGLIFRGTSRRIERWRYNQCIFGLCAGRYQNDKCDFF